MLVGPNTIGPRVIEIHEIELLAEIGVVLEEWRQRDQGLGSRIFDVYGELLTTGTSLEGRTPLASQSNGNCEIEVNPGMVLTSFSQNSPVGFSKKRSTRAMP